MLQNKLLPVLESKLSDSVQKTFSLGIIAGVFISFGAFLFTLITTLDSQSASYKLLGSMVFTTGLILVVLRKAQLFTGNHLMFSNFFINGQKIKSLLRNWTIVYFGNFFGAIICVACISIVAENFPDFSSRLSAIAVTKTSYPVSELLIRGILCNILVCLGIFLAIVSEKILFKLFGLLLPITTFVYFGFEHSIANMFFIPAGLYLTPTPIGNTYELFLYNLIPVTLGNILGGLIISVALILALRKR